MNEKTFEQVVEELRGKPLLVANRGITARRIVRTIRERLDALAIMTATEVDKTSPAAAGAQELMLLGPDPRAYLDLDRIIRMAKQRGVVGIHPGWGFASENEEFPAKCAAAGLTFIGSTAQSMRLLGNKVEVRRLARSLDIPVVPGSEGSVDVAEARRLVHEMGLPVMLKAEGGGGGRGIYEVYDEKNLESAFDKASTMAQASFGNPCLFVEKLLTSVRHIEIQVVADKYGNAFAFDERDCTVQRNHQKLVEITPSPWKGLTPELRTRLKEYSLRLVKACNYHSLATVEFLIDGDGQPYLIEVNTRLQVEHGITESRYGIDLVEEQIAIAFGAKLRFDEENTTPVHHAVQVRINMEDPRANFSPNSGMVTRYLSPGGPGIRLDSNLSQGYEFPSQYDSAGALLIAYGRSWDKVLATMNRALREYTVGGLKTTIPFFRQIIGHPMFQAGEFNTNFVATTPELMCYRDEEPEAVRLSRLVAEISAMGFNPHVALGKYRTRSTPRLGRFECVLPPVNAKGFEHPYPSNGQDAIDFIRDSGYVHFTDTTARDITQSNSGNRFRLAEDELMGPYLDNCGFFSLENGGGAHFHVAMLANMTYPFTEAAEWNRFAPRTMKQILIRSTNVLGYKPQPKNLMRLTGEMICEHYHVIRCFDFLNHIENMYPFAEVAMNNSANIFEPAISVSWAKGFDTPHYLKVVEEILEMCGRAAGCSTKAAERKIILGLKDMAGMCPPRFMRELVGAIRKRWPDLVLHYHRHYTDGLFVPALGAAAEAGAHIVDTAIGSSVRWYGQGDVLSTAAYIEDEIGLKTNLNKEMIRDCNFVLKQIMPYYDRYTAPYFQGIDYDVVEHGMPGGATSSSQEGAMKQGYIHLLPYMLKFLAATRKIVRYHDVTPGSQITWNVSFLAVTSAFKRGGEKEVQHLLNVMDAVNSNSEAELSEEMKKARLAIYKESNDAFRNLLLGKFGRLPLGFPPDWVYESAFGASEYKKALRDRTETSPLLELEDINIEEERLALNKQLKRQASDEEFVLYLNHPGDALKTIAFRSTFGDPNRLPLDVWFEGLEPGVNLTFVDSRGKPHQMNIVHINRPDPSGRSGVRYSLDSEIMTHEVQVKEVVAGAKTDIEMADPSNKYHIASPNNGDLWVMYASPGEVVKAGEELFNISIMKQEKSVFSPMDGIVKRVLKTADFREDKKMIPVREGELLVELGPVPQTCPHCNEALVLEKSHFCPCCGGKLDD